MIMTNQQKLKAFEKLYSFYKTDVDKDASDESRSCGLCSTIHCARMGGRLTYQEMFFLLEYIKSYINNKTFLYNEDNVCIRNRPNRKNTFVSYGWPLYEMRPRLRWLRHQIKKFKSI